MTLEEYILTYKGITSSGDEGFVCNIADYYDKYVMQLDNKFKERSLNGSRLVICPLHDDHDPSLGLINHRFLKGVKIFHCFGCGTSGTVVRLHQLIEHKYNNRKLSDEDACKELADMFNIDISNFDELSEDDYEGKYIQSMKRLDNLIRDSYNISDYELELLNARSSSNRNTVLSKTNEALIKMVASTKDLYD